MFEALDDLNQRLDAIAAQMARLTKAERREPELTQELTTATADVERLHDQLSREVADVARLEGSSLSGLLHSLLGDRADALDKERQEAVAAQLKYDAALSRKAALARDLEAVQAERRSLAGVKAEHDALLVRKEEAISRQAGSGARELFAFGEREQQARWAIQQITEAQTAGTAAHAALERVVDALQSAQGYGTWDMLGGGLIATALKHSRIDDAKEAAHDAEAALVAFRRELKDVQVDLQAPDVSVDGFLKFADFFFDGLLADWMVQSRINQSLQTARDAQGRVAQLQDWLRGELRHAQTELAQTQQDRTAFIEQFRSS